MRHIAAFRALFFALALLVQHVAVAQTYPHRPITLIVPFGAGGATDLSARKIAELLGRQLGQPVVVENKPGAGGIVGMAALARAKPDGYTLGWAGNSPLTIAPYLSKHAPYDPTKFAPVSLACLSSFVYAARPSLGVSNLQGLVALARKRPGAITFASTGVGTSTHMLTELLASVSGIKLLHVPYKSELEGATALMAGDTDMMVMSAPIGLPLYASGKLLPMASTGSARLQSSLNVPTVAEAGYPSLQMELFFGLVAPANTPTQIVDRLNSEMQKAIANPSYAEVMHKAGYSAAGGSVEDFTNLINRHAKEWQALIKKNSISIE